DGGQLACVGAGGAVATDAVAPVPAEFTVEFQPQLLANADQVKVAMADDTALVDGRPVAQYSGKQKAPVVRVAGTIPTAVNIEQSNFYDGKFATSDVVARLTAAAGVTPQEKTITFCNTGHWASIAWFGLSEVGGNQNVALYDGSMAEWTLDEARPVQ
ncbi:MAG: rhodanese-like domain-containing protein, partial [Paracoccaceae bacterium]|nr:rhodanese-like domain-containing protein [Paracoccaceae bacterium]